MSLIKIIANNIELDFVKETLSIKKENNALNRDFKVSYSSIPFLIIENVNTKIALGTRDLSSVKKIKTIDVVVFEGGKKYSGELQILSYLNGFRKCNLKYASSLLSIMNKKISEFMPIVSVIPGETNPVVFTEKSMITSVGSDNWQSYPLPFLSQGFPDVKWQFPTMSWIKKYGSSLTASDAWFNFKDKINAFDESGLIPNTATLVSGDYVVSNQNVVAPQVYLLSPLFYALNSIGFTFSGAFANSEFVKKILILSNKNNLTQTHPYRNEADKIITELANHHLLPGRYVSIQEITVTNDGFYILDYNFGEFDSEFQTGTTNRYFQFTYDGTIYKAYTHNSDFAKTYSGSIVIPVKPATVIKCEYFSTDEIVPSNIVKVVFAYEKEYHQMHPTIQLGRYVPDWTFGTYLNALKNMFNLEINIDDLAKKVTLDFNEETISMGSKAVLKKSLAVNSYEQSPSDAFLLKYENSEDVALWITKESAATYGIQNSDFVERLDNKFKFIPTTYTAELSEALDSKSGVGLMIYDPVFSPYTVGNYLEQTLKIEGSKGIYEVFWRKFIKFLLNGSPVEMSGPFTETELNSILSLKRIFIDNQEYLIASTESQETDQNNYEVKFSLVSVTF